MYMPVYILLSEILRTKGLGFFIDLGVFICENNSYLCCRQLGERPSDVLINKN